MSLTFEPTTDSERIGNLDLLRGAAVLGSFYVSAVAYGLPHAAFFNLKSPGANSWSDWIAALVGEMLFDQKAVVLLALLYGTGVGRLASRASEADAKAGRLSLRRALVLFCIGIPVGFHGLLWEGTPLWFFAFFTPLLFVLRNRSTRALVGIGAFLIVFSASTALDFQPETDEEAAGLGQYWITGSHGGNDLVGGFMALGTMSLLLGALILGLALDRWRLFDADPTGQTAQRMIRWGLGLGLPLAVATVIWRFIGDYQLDVAIIAEAPNTLAAIPLTLGYVGLLTRWGPHGSLRWLGERIECVGQMALTNTVAQAAFGRFALRDYGFERGYFSRTGLVVVVLVVWSAQLVGSKAWLDRFEYGPLEWVLRSATYWRRLDLTVKR